MTFRTAATTAALAVVLAVVGAVTGPQWDPQPVAEHLEPATSDTTIGGQPSGGVDGIGTYDVRETPVTVRLDGTSVGGILREPVGADGDRPGMVFVHGAGTGKATEAFVEVATELASAGVVTLVPDKRLDTYTTRHRDYAEMAQDYARSVELLRERPGVDPDAVGVYGESEGTWIVPVMAAQDPRIAFSVLVSAPVVPPREQAAFAVDSYLRNTDVPHGVFRAIPRAVGMAIPGGGFEYADFDVEPYLEELSQPVLVVYGTADPSMPVEQGARQVLDATADQPGAGTTVRYYDGANHGIKVGEELVPQFPRDVAAWVQSLPASADAPPQVAGAQPNQQYLAGPVPTPRWLGNGDLFVALVVAAVGVLVLGPLVRSAAVLVGRLRRVVGRTVRPTGLAPGVRWPLLALGVGAIATTVGLVVYLLAVARLALDYEKDAWVVQGGWVAVRLAGLATLVAAAQLLNRWLELRAGRRTVRLDHRPGHGTVDRPEDPARDGPEDPTGDRPEDRTDDRRGAAAHGPVAVSLAQGVSARVMLGCVLVGTTVLLVVLAYWGVYQLGI
ncbi:prolyl oligopeptidase family serine peptidase [Cellulosimicrobium sp. CUA-896]|uniref:alpha/beta hydrolase family protein n=1 Tax=Cellulosimicrobium sp. CUA-896 TaxID=1517881 RepID=UPI000962CC15|nr:prolyl oligopeptidase family serine peptidase [Cellulosimicrobium sp. CUA-896]OLT54000.1 dienelactone hydrolase [Cellulosimicrobium sp. CUA-896]